MLDFKRLVTDLAGQFCPNLIELQIINARVSTNDHECISEHQSYFFSKLKLVYFFFVKYKFPSISSKNTPISALHCILQHAKHLEGLQATGSSTLTDDCLDRCLSINPVPRSVADRQSSTEQNNIIGWSDVNLNFINQPYIHENYYIKAIKLTFYENFCTSEKMNNFKKVYRVFNKIWNILVFYEL